MKTYKLLPMNIEIGQNGIAYRPFKLDDEIIYYANMNILFNNNEDSKNEINKLCETISEKINFHVDNELFPKLVNKEFFIKNGEIKYA